MRRRVERNELGLVQIVGAINLDDVLNGTIDGGVPAVIKKSVQVCLVDGASSKMTSIVFPFVFWPSKDVYKRVQVVLQPKFVIEFDVSLRLNRVLKRQRLTRVDNYILLVDSRWCPCTYWSKSILKLSYEPIIPTFITVVRQVRIALEPIVMNLLLCLLRKPSQFWLIGQVLY